MRYDIVLVSYNSERWIPGCMEALRHVDYDAAQLHVVVVDNGSRDGTLGRSPCSPTEKIWGSERRATGARHRERRRLCFF